MVRLKTGAFAWPSRPGPGTRASLLRDAVNRATAVSHDAGVRAILARALNDGIKRFREHFGFQVSPLPPVTLMSRLNSLERWPEATARCSKFDSLLKKQACFEKRNQPDDSRATRSQHHGSRRFEQRIGF